MLVPMRQVACPIAASVAERGVDAESLGAADQSEPVSGTIAKL